MSRLLWASIGMAVGACVLHVALGLKRPRDRTYLSFAYIMALLALYLYFEWELYRADTSEAAVEIVRRQVAAAHGLLAGILVFVPAYTSVRIPPLVIAAYWGGLTIVFFVNLSARYGVSFSGPPEVIGSMFLGEPYTALLAPAMSPLQYLHALYVISVFVFAFRCAVKLCVRGERRRGATLAIALVVLVLCHITDLVHDAVGGTWPYVAEFGLVAWGLVMSMQLAIDFRVVEDRLRATLKRAERTAAELAAMIDATLDVRDLLNTPLQTLEVGLAVRTRAATDEEVKLADLRHAVRQLTQLGRAVEQAASQRSMVAASERAR